MTALGMYCGFCGLADQRPDTDDLEEERGPGDHERCRSKLELEPPRYCTECGRRMKVQVTPRDWRATCVKHGTVPSETGTT